MNRILTYLFLLAGLAAGIWFFVIQPDDKGISIAEDAFSVEDTSAVHEIFLADMSGRKISLQRQSKGDWTVNGKYKARQSGIDLLLETIALQQVKYPVAKSAVNNVVREMAGEHIKVELYDQDKEKLNAYFVGSPPQSDRGNFMMLDYGEKTSKRKKKPFIVQIRGLDGFLHTRYIMEESDWRDRTVLSAKVDDIQSVKVLYPANPDSSWALTRNEIDEFDIEARLSATGNKPVNQRATVAHLQNYWRINAEVFMNDWASRDSVQASPPICVISLETKDGEKQECRLHYRALTRRDKAQLDYFGNPYEFSRDKYYAVFNDGRDFGLVQHFVFGKLLIGPSYFVQPEPGS